MSKAKNFKLTPKQESFCQEFMENGGNASEAYRSAYSTKRMKPATVNVEATRLLSHPKVSLRIENLRKKIKKRHNLTIDDILSELDEARNVALNPPERSSASASAAVTATMSKAKLLGLDKIAEDDRNKEEPAYMGIPAHLVGPAFGYFLHDLIEHKYTHYWQKGGRGGLKSTTVSLAIIDDLIRNPDGHVVVLREVFGTHKDSTYSQLIWAIDQLGLNDKFTATKSPLEIKYIPTGQTIFFRGLDDPIKLKSIKPSFGYIRTIWFEEVAEVDGMETIRNVLQSLMRGGEEFNCFYTYNPPRSNAHWVNEAVQEEALREDTKVYHFDYLSVPKSWLGKPFLVQAEHLKSINELAYRHEYLGEAVGTGGEVFDNIVIDDISQDFEPEITRYGVDFGFSVDPFVAIKIGYNRLFDTLYIFGEFCGIKVHDDEAADRIREIGNKREPVFCDSEDPKGISNLKREGINAIGCKKFAGSRMHGFKFLQRWARIVIDPRLCPDASKEFQQCEWEKDKNGKIISSIAKKNDHTIDAVRYALDREISHDKDTKSTAVRMV